QLLSECIDIHNQHGARTREDRLVAHRTFKRDPPDLCATTRLHRNVGFLRIGHEKGVVLRAPSRHVMMHPPAYITGETLGSILGCRTVPTNGPQPNIWDR